MVPRANPITEISVGLYCRMSITDGSFLQRLFSARALTSISHYFFMNAYSLWTDLLLGFLIAGALGA